MNTMQRRLLRRYVERGGDLNDKEAIEALFRKLRTAIVLMPGGVRTALESALEAREDTTYRELAVRLAERTGKPLTASAFRQRIARGLRELERIVNFETGRIEVGQGAARAHDGDRSR